MTLRTAGVWLRRQMMVSPVLRVGIVKAGLTAEIVNAKTIWTKRTAVNVVPLYRAAVRPVSI